MGQLVFQATLGGQTNLVGPNTASTYNIDVPTVNGTLVTTGDTATVTSAMINGPVTVAKGGTGQSSYTDGQLLIGNSTGNTLTKATLTAGSGISITNGSGSIQINNTSAASGGSVVTGSVTLTSSSNPVQSVTSTDYGQYVKLPDATTMSEITNSFGITNKGMFPLKIIDNQNGIIGFLYPDTTSIVGLVDNSTAAGSWTCTNLDLSAVTTVLNYTTNYTARETLVLDTNRTFFTLSTSTALYGQIFNSSTNSWGAITLIRTAAVTSNNSIILTATDTILCVSDAATAREAVVLSISGTTITVNTAATATVTTGQNHNNFIAIGSAYVLYSVISGTAGYVTAFTVSGTTVTIGTALSLGGSTTGGDIFAVSSTVGLAVVYINATSMRAEPFSISGVTITLGTILTVNSTAINAVTASVIGSQWIAVYQNSSSTISATVISVTGTIATGSTVSGVISHTSVSGIRVSGNKCTIWANPTNYNSFNIVTNTLGVATAGTAYERNVTGISTPNLSFVTGDTLCFTATRSTSGWLTKTIIDVSGSSPSLVSTDTIYAASSAGNYGATVFSSYLQSTVGVGLGLISSGTQAVYTPLTVINATKFYLAPTRLMYVGSVFYNNGAVAWTQGSGSQSPILNQMVRVECIA